MSDTTRMDSAFNQPTSTTPRRNWQLDQCYREGCKLERELAEAQNLLKQCLSAMPVGYIPTHTAENLPEMICDLAKALAEETTERENLERELAAVTEQRDRLAEAINVSLARAYASGYMHGHEATVEGQFTPLMCSDYKDFFKEDVRQMHIDECFPELMKALAAVEGGPQ